jgi:hypothetical protein
MNLNINNSNRGEKFTQTAQQNIAQKQSIVNADSPHAKEMLAAMNDGYSPADALAMGSSFTGASIPSINIPTNQNNNNNGTISSGADSQNTIGQQGINQNMVEIGGGYFASASSRVREYTPPVTKPPVSYPPVTHPPVTHPPVTHPPVTNPPVTPPPTPDYFTIPCKDPETDEIIYEKMSTHRDFGRVMIDGKAAYFSIDEFTKLASEKFGGFPPNGQAGVIALINSGELKRVATAANGLPDAPPNPAIEGEDYITTDA